MLALHRGERFARNRRPGNALDLQRFPKLRASAPMDLDSGGLGQAIEPESEGALKAQ